METKKDALDLKERFKELEKLKNQEKKPKKPRKNGKVKGEIPENPIALPVVENVQVIDNNDFTNVYKITLRQYDFLEAYVKNDFHIGDTCRQFNVTRQCYYTWMKDENFRKAFDDFREHLVDRAEKTLANLAANNDKDAAKFILKYLGKKRGYVDSIDITTNGESIRSTVINIIAPLKKEDGDNV